MLLRVLSRSIGNEIRFDYGSSIRVVTSSSDELVTNLLGSTTGFEESVLRISKIFAYTDADEIEVGVGSGEPFPVISQNPFDDTLLVTVVGIWNTLEIFEISDCARYCCELPVVPLIEVETCYRNVLTVLLMLGRSIPMTRHRTVLMLGRQSYVSVSN